MISPDVSRLTVVHPAFGNWEKLLNLNFGNQLEYTIDFRERASVQISAFDEQNQPIEADVIINGEFMEKQSPLLIELPYGRHYIELRAAGYETIQVTKELDVANQQPENLKLQMKKK